MFGISINMFIAILGIQDLTTIDIEMFKWQLNLITEAYQNFQFTQNPLFIV